MSRARAAARWLPAPVADPAVVAALTDGLRPNGDRAHKPALPALLLRLLAVRGIHAADEAKRFLRPERAQLTPPDALTDLPRAAARIASAVRGGELLLVHGDYDVDGICSTALLARVLRGLGARVECFIPDRKRDGYDLGPAGVARAKALGATLVITCDCGTTAVAAARALRGAGIDLIITDHHRPGPELPPAVAIVNPQREADVATRADRHLAAVGVAWKLAQAVSALCGGAAEDVEDQLELVALATVADVAPLVGDNRILVAEGLRQMATPRRQGERAPRNLGLRALMRAAGLDERRLTAGRLGFVVAPRLNALGRIRQALTGVDLLLADDESRALDLAAECSAANDERQRIDRAILEDARRRVDAVDLSRARGLVLHAEGWEPGVIGIVASRIVELTHRPTFLIAVTGEGGVPVGKGSGRSVPGFDLHAALTECGDLLERFGGHRAAAGLTIRPERIPEFAARFDAIARARLTDEDLVPALRPDLELSIEDADESLLQAIRYLEPFGVGNAGPVLVSRAVRVRGGARAVGTDGLKMDLVCQRGPREAVGWGLGARRGEVPRDGAVDIAYRLELNEYRGARTLQASLLDFRASG